MAFRRQTDALQQAQARRDRERAQRCDAPLLHARMQDGTEAMQPADEGAGGRQAEQAALASEQEGQVAWRVVGAAVGGKVQGGCRAEVGLEALLLEDASVFGPLP